MTLIHCLPLPMTIVAKCSPQTDDAKLWHLMLLPHGSISLTQLLFSTSVCQGLFCVFVFLSIHLFLFLSVCSCVCVCVCPSVPSSCVHLFLNLSVYLKNFLSRHQSVHTYLHLHGSQFIYLSFACPNIWRLKKLVQATKHLSNHVEELEQKILSVIESILQQHLSTWTASSASLPSANFRALCKQVWT